MKATISAILEADVLHQIVVKSAPALNCLDNCGEVVINQDHVTGFLGDFSSRDAHGNADISGFQRGRIVHSVARHSDYIALLLERLDHPDFVFWSDSRNYADCGDALVQLVVTHGGQFRAGYRFALDAKLGGNRSGGRCVVAGNHPNPDSGVVAKGNSVFCFLARRIDDADKTDEVAGSAPVPSGRLPGRMSSRGDVSRRAWPSPGGPPMRGDRSQSGRARGIRQRGARAVYVWELDERESRTSGAPLTKQRTTVRRTTSMSWNVAMNLYAESNGTSPTRG